MKQSAVEWLFEQINNLSIIDPAAADLIQDILKYKEQAKEMEKEQIVRAHLMARCYDNENSVTESEQYYTETYESKTNF